MDRRRFILNVGSGVLAQIAFAQRGISRTLYFSAGREQERYALKSDLHSPFFVWPLTLLSYHLDSNDRFSPETHRLRCLESGQEVPFQIGLDTDALTSNRRTLLFFTDLPSTSGRTFVMEKVKIPASKLHNTSGIHIVNSDGILTIDTGPLQVRLPTALSSAKAVPGPIIGFSRHGRWTGRSSLELGDLKVLDLSTVPIEEGPLRSTHRICYRFSDESRYSVLVQCYAGLDYVRLLEDMSELASGSTGLFEFSWTDCEFNFRQAPNHPWPEQFPPNPLGRYTDYPWEPIFPEFIASQFGVANGADADEKLPFSLCTFDPWADVGAASFANFWSLNSSDAAGIFIDRPELWDDREYAIWHSSRRNAVKFGFRHQTLSFLWPLNTGTRSSCIAFYDHQNDMLAMQRIEAAAAGVRTADGLFKTTVFPTSYALNLQIWHGALSLDKVKDWQLVYSEDKRRPAPLFTTSTWERTSDFYDEVTQSSVVNEIALSGFRQNHGFGPTSSRRFMDAWVPGYQFHSRELSAEDRRRVDAVLLLLAYVHAGEDYMPLERMLAGHPNFLSDVKAVAAGIAYLFPDHPAADEWADKWEAAFRLNMRYHTRPAVRQWGAKGGRWTENLGTYVWAFLRPALRASFLLKCRDGHERLAIPQATELGNWLVNALSAPFAGESKQTMRLVRSESRNNEGAARHYWGIVTHETGPRRLYPPVGAHSERRKPPRSLWYLGNALRQYAPLVAEHLMWAARPGDQDFELVPQEPDPYAVMYSRPDNRGTNPHLSSSKFTGYGITLRAAVDTPDELSVHLVQIDDGPNYRWGNGSEGTCGVLYFYACGQAYSHNATEDTGDRLDQDTDFATNFGVWKNGAFRSIGQNVLSAPLQDLGIAQFAQILARSGPTAYSWPEYISRSVLLIGSDYFVVFDHVYDPQVPHRFSWFVRKGDAFPKIISLSSNHRSESDLSSTVETEKTSGRWMDGLGSSVVLITHKNGILAERTLHGSRIITPSGEDRLFISAENIAFKENNDAFTGMIGVIRHRHDTCELALFCGTCIAAEDFLIQTTDTNLAISAILGATKNVSGQFVAAHPSRIAITWNGMSSKHVFFVDGESIESSPSSNTINVDLPAGSHTWELTDNLPCPLSPSVIRTEYFRDGVIAHGTQVASSSSYSIEMSDDNCVTWQHAADSSEPIFTLSGLLAGSKYHVRLIARNGNRQSAPGKEYPLYITNLPPEPPDGLSVELSQGAAELTWGEVLGVTSYRLYRKWQEENSFSIVYEGLSRNWRDKDARFVASCNVPAPSNPRQSSCSIYYVTAVNRNGESRESRRADTDPKSWRNWNPTGDEKFRRTEDLTSGPMPNDGFGRYYPE